MFGCSGVGEFGKCSVHHQLNVWILGGSNELGCITSICSNSFGSRLSGCWSHCEVLWKGKIDVLCCLDWSPYHILTLHPRLLSASQWKDPITGENHHLVQGITTAAATWLSAAVGLACGGGLYFTASFATAMNLVILRFGPRAAGSVGGDWTSNELLTGMDIENPDADGDKMSPDNKEQSYGGTTFETQPLRQNMASLSMRSRPGLGRVDTVSVRNRPTLM